MRAVAARLRDFFKSQHSFLATSVMSLFADIRLFLSYNSCKTAGVDAFKKILKETKNCLLLMFDDVRHPKKVMNLVENTKHCVIFTSVCEWTGIEEEIVSNTVSSEAVNPLSRSDCFLLFEHVLADRKCKTALNGLYVL